MLKELTINDAVYHCSDENDAVDDPSSNPKVDTHSSDLNKRRVIDTSNGNLQQKLLINWKIPIITMKIDPQILERVVTFGGTPKARHLPQSNSSRTRRAEAYGISGTLGK